MAHASDTSTRAEDILLREEIVLIALAMDNSGFAPSKSGNVSARCKEGFLITPSGLPYAQMKAADLVAMTLDGAVVASANASANIGADTGADANTRIGARPSSEWPFHAAIYRARPDAMAIVHTHSPRATALAATRRGIPAFHYMIAMAGGADIRCADYATFGSDELAANAVKALEGRKAALLANHGVIALGGSLKGAWAIAFEVENLAGQYLHIMASGLSPVILDEAEMARVSARFASYGKLG